VARKEDRSQMPRAQRRAKWWSETKIDLKWATALLFVLILGISGYLWASWGKAPAAEEDLNAITDLIFAQDGLVAPFEILSVLLLAALIAGVVVAFRDPEESEP
jgi:NADH:ubiquinone oxidoreductase subunit 6 (subunit J)